MFFKKKSSNFWFLSLIILIVLIISWHISEFAINYLFSSLKASLLNRIKILSLQINPNEIKQFSGTISDLTSEVYLKYQKLFQAYCNLQSDIRYTYMFGLKDNNIVFYIDSEPSKTNDEKIPLAKPGEIYDDAPNELKEIFFNKSKNYVFGPYKDKWGTFFSAMYPIYDTDGKSIVCVIGMDIKTKNWQFEIITIRLATFSSLLLITFLTLITYFLIKKQNIDSTKLKQRLTYQQIIFSLLKYESVLTLDETLTNITKDVANILNVTSVSIWRFNEANNTLVCEKKYNKMTNSYESNYTFDLKLLNNYLNTLTSQKSIVVNNVDTIDLIFELKELYLNPLNISSFIQATIWLRGKPYGIISVENNTKRDWENEEIDFIHSISHILSIFYETHEYISLENKERNVRLFLEKIINSISDPIFVKDSNHRFVLVNEPLAKLINKPINEIIGKTDYDFFPIEQVEVFLKMDNKLLETGEENINEEKITDFKGNVRTILTKKNLYRDNDGNRYIVGVIHDITEQKKIEEEKLKISKLESIGLLAGGIAHDFNNILMGLVGNITLLKKKITDKNLLSILSRTENIVHRAKNLTEQLITFSKGGLPIKKECNIINFIKNTISFVLSGSKMKVNYAFDENLPTIEIDEGQLTQAIVNIIINARQACNDEGIISIEIKNHTATYEIFPYTPNKYIKISINDNGPGIPEENLSKIFEPYFTTKDGSSGLGLFVTYSIITKHGGYIRALSSKEQHGTTIEIYLPVNTIPHTQTQNNNSLTDKLNLNKSGYNILIMDDELDAIIPLCDLLFEKGHKVSLASNGEEALKMYETKIKKGEKFDIIIANVVVKNGMGAEELAKKIIEIDSNACMIVTSGYVRNGIMSKYQEYGFKKAITKPYDIDDLMLAISEVLNNKK